MCSVACLYPHEVNGNPRRPNVGYGVANLSAGWEYKKAEL